MTSLLKLNITCLWVKCICTYPTFQGISLFFPFYVVYAQYIIVVQNVGTKSIFSVALYGEDGLVFGKVIDTMLFL